MTRYRYTVIAPNGRKRSGQIEAGSRDQAEALISSDGDLLIDLSDTEQRRLFSLERSSDLPSSTATDFALELAGLLTAGASLRRALDIQTEGRSKPAELARSIRKHIDEGGTLSSGLKASGGSGTLLAEFAAAGEAGAGLETLLDVGGRFLAARQQALSEIRRRARLSCFHCPPRHGRCGHYHPCGRSSPCADPRGIRQRLCAVDARRHRYLADHPQHTNPAFPGRRATCAVPLGQIFECKARIQSMVMANASVWDNRQRS